MKANELMIGDWVLGLVEDNEEIGKIIAKHPARIIKIEENGDYAAQCPYTFDEMYEGDGTLIEDFLWYDTEPIPLTAEILKQNGFEEKTESNPFVYYLFKDGDNSVSLEHTYDTTDKEDYWACCIGNRLCDVCTISMHYIHELQHALRLCGIDKEIVL